MAVGSDLAHGGRYRQTKSRPLHCTDVQNGALGGQLAPLRGHTRCFLGSHRFTRTSIVANDHPTTAQGFQCIVGGHPKIAIFDSTYGGLKIALLTAGAFFKGADLRNMEIAPQIRVIGWGVHIDQKRIVYGAHGCA